MMDNKKLIAFPLSILVLGTLAGLGAGLLSLFMERVEGLFLHFKENSAHPSALSALPVQRLGSVVLGGLIAAVIWYFIRRQTKIPKIAETMAGKSMPFWFTTLHILTQIFYVGTGGSVGRELAPRELGSLFANKWQELLNKFELVSFTDEERALLIASAAGAGFAGAYIAPITGMLFCIEILHKKISVQTVSVSLSMAVVAMMVGRLIKGDAAYYALGTKSFPISLMLMVLIIGPLCGLLGAYFRKAFIWAEANQSHSAHLLWQLPLASLVTGMIAYFFPEIMGNGRALAQTAMNAQLKSLIPFFALLIFLKGLMTVLTIRSGASGGTLTPAIGMGAALGAIVCLIIPGFSVWQGAIIGASAMLAAAQQAPLMALFMLIEVSHLPIQSAAFLGFGVAIAMAISQLILNPATILALDDE